MSDFVFQFAMQIHRTKVCRFFFVLFGSETSSPTLREERGLRVLRVLRGMCMAKRDEVTGVEKTT